jgi:hypothetical protein
MSQLAIYNYGLELIKEYKLEEKRHIYIVDTNDCKIEHEIINKAINYIKDKVNLNNYDMKIVEKKYEKGDSMKWHRDDCAIFRHKNNYEAKNNNIKINDKFTLYYTKLPIYSMIIYLSTYNIDFTGGKFQFVNTEIIPEKNKVILFDSREIHKVSDITSGSRHCILIKFFQKI